MLKKTQSDPTDPDFKPYEMRRLSYAGTFTNPFKAGTIRAVEEAIAGGDAAIAAAALQAAQPEIMRGVSKGILHKNTASRKVSRLAARVKAMSA